MNKIQPSTLIEGYESEEVKKFAQRGDGNMNKLLIDQTADLRNKIDTYKEKEREKIWKGEKIKEKKRRKKKMEKSQFLFFLIF